MIESLWWGLVIIIGGALGWTLSGLLYWIKTRKVHEPVREFQVPDLTAMEIHILLHTLGYYDSRAAKSYRHYFSVKEGGSNWPAIHHLCKLGLIMGHDISGITDNNHIFMITDRGMKVAEIYRFSDTRPVTKRS